MLADGEQKPQDGSSFGHLRAGRARAAVRGVIWAGLNGFAPAVVAAGVFTLTSRYLTPAEYGLVMLAASISFFASAIAPAGFGDALIQRQDVAKRHVDAVFWLCIGTALAIYGGLLLLTPLLAKFLGQAGLLTLIPVVGLRVIFDQAAIVPGSLLARSMSFDKIALRTTVASLVSAAVCVPLLLMGYGVWALALSFVAGSIATFLASFLSVTWRPALSFSLKSLREVARYGAFASGTRTVQLLNVDQLLIGWLMGTAPLGIFGFARRIYQILNDLIAGALRAVSFTMLSSLQTEHEKLKETYLFATFASSAFSFPVFVGLALIAGDLVPLVFGSHWAEAVPALQAFCAIGLLSCIGVLQSSLITSQGKVGWWMSYQAAQQILSAVVVLALFRFGITTVVVAMAVKTLLAWPVSVGLTLRILRLGAFAYARQFVAPTVASLLMVAGVLAVRYTMPETHSVVNLAVEVLTGAVVYVAVLLAMVGRRLLRMRDLIMKRGAVPS
ncbi:lipopolysaccharide biosynthesis protein [Chelativorans sp. AA-79]|uniref:lipopolysaccharide biosynthesis protein n=1 Tax=Chelativorans sp. AA-79 TaxID=3028735 RepID=UPI0023F8D039|nr:lipopolysaccharide biosynthesis protein [Chelativorans sp. AA-79]WEX08173.1 lipopolysaccharide biosynthesis protein [Chelativorans sp. AA-79]